MTRIFNRLLQALLNLAGSKAMPSDNLTTVFQGNGDYDQILTAPDNGYYSIDCTSSTQSNTFIQGSVLSYISGTDRQAVYTPCRKGQSIRISTNSIGSVTVRFRTLQGGGVL